MKLRWKQGTGEPPIGAVIEENESMIVWQVLQYYAEPLFMDEEEEDCWLDIPVVIEE